MPRLAFGIICTFILCSFQVSLWKETLEGQWVIVSDVNKGQGQSPGQGQGLKQERSDEAA